MSAYHTCTFTFIGVRFFFTGRNVNEEIAEPTHEGLCTYALLSLKLLQALLTLTKLQLTSHQTIYLHVHERRPKHE